MRFNSVQEALAHQLKPIEMALDAGERSWAVPLKSSVGTMSTTVRVANGGMAGAEKEARKKAEEWANNHPEHGKYKPWSAGIAVGPLY